MAGRQRGGPGRRDTGDPVTRGLAWLLLAATLGPSLAMAQELDVGRPHGLVALEVETSCESAVAEDLSAALEVELGAWRREAIALHCAPMRVRFTFERCDQPAAARIDVVAAGQAPLVEEVPAGDASNRALALAAAELVEHAYLRCAAEPTPPPPPRADPEPWRDPRPLATDADRVRYFREIEFNRRLMLRASEVGTTVLVQMRAGAYFDALRSGVGGSADGSLSASVAGGLYLRAELGPAGLAGGEGPALGQLGGALLVGYDLGLFAFALGGGVGTGNARPGAPPLGRVDAYLRMGVEPDVYGAVLIALAVEEGGVEFGLVSARFGAPVSPTVVIYWRAEAALAFASGRVDVGVRLWLDGDIASSSGIALEVGVGAAGIYFAPRCEFGPCDERTLALGPGAHLGLTLREGN